MFEAMISTTWLAAHTSRLSLGTLVLCDSFRHPAQLAREAVSLDHASGGRFELGIGWGSVAREFDIFGVGSTEPRFPGQPAQGIARHHHRPVAWRGLRLRGGALHAALGTTAPDAPRPHSHRDRWGGKEDDGTGGHLRGLVEPAHSDPGPLRGDAATGRPGPALPAGADGAGRIRGPARGDRRRPPSAASARASWPDRPIELVDYFGSLGGAWGRTRLRLVHRFRSQPRRWPSSAHR